MVPKSIRLILISQSGSSLRDTSLTQDLNNCEKNVEMEKNIFCQHTASRTFL